MSLTFEIRNSHWGEFHLLEIILIRPYLILSAKYSSEIVKKANKGNHGRHAEEMCNSFYYLRMKICIWMNFFYIDSQCLFAFLLSFCQLKSSDDFIYKKIRQINDIGKVCLWFEITLLLRLVVMSYIFYNNSFVYQTKTDILKQPLHSVHVQHTYMLNIKFQKTNERQMLYQFQRLDEWPKSE